VRETYYGLHGRVGREEGIIVNRTDFAFPSLETDRLHLRILTLQDTEEVFRHFADENITQFMDIEPCKDLQEAEEIIRFHMEDPGCRWGIFDRSTGALIGTCGYHCLRGARGGDSFIAEVGFDLAKLYWGQGIMHEVMKAVIDFGFIQMGLTAIDATVDPANERSRGLMRKLGFQEEPEPRDNLVYFYINSKAE